MVENEGAVYISLGDNVDLGITSDGRLVVQKTDQAGRLYERIFLGNATKQRIEAVGAYLDRLKIHAVDA